MHRHISPPICMLASCFAPLRSTSLQAFVGTGRPGLIRASSCRGGRASRPTCRSLRQLDPPPPPGEPDLHKFGAASLYRTVPPSLDSAERAVLVRDYSPPVPRGGTHGDFTSTPWSACATRPRPTVRKPTHGRHPVRGSYVPATGCQPGIGKWSRQAPRLDLDIRGVSRTPRPLVVAEMAPRGKNGGPG